MQKKKNDELEDIAKYPRWNIYRKIFILKKAQKIIEMWKLIKCPNIYVIGDFHAEREGKQKNIFWRNNDWKISQIWLKKIIYIYKTYIQELN